MTPTRWALRLVAVKAVSGRSMYWLVVVDGERIGSVSDHNGVYAAHVGPPSKTVHIGDYRTRISAARAVRSAHGMTKPTTTGVQA